MQLREAKTTDSDAIVRLIPTEDELFRVYPRGRHPFSVDQLHSLSLARKELTVAVEQERIVGFANLYDVVQNESAFIGNVVVDAAYRGQGIGRTLVSHMTGLAFDKYAVGEARISVFNDNTPALLLYSAMRFMPYAVEERVNPSGKRIGLIHMRLKRDDHSA